MGIAFEDADFSPVNFFIEQAFGNSSTLGHSPIANIFAQNPNISNSFDVYLSRTNDLDDTNTGTFLIAEHLDQFISVTNEPRLPRVTEGRWSVPCDGMKVNGQSFAFNKSSVAGVAEGSIAVVLDSGFTDPPLPPAAVDAIYSTIPGAINLNNTDSTPNWLIPCDGTTNLTFSFG